MNIHIINGPNLNLLGKREPDVYGKQTFEEYLEKLKADLPEHNLTYYQSNIEGELINELHKAGQYDVIIMNPGGYTHTSVAIADAIAAIGVPVIEVHISNIFAREEYRHISITGKNCRGSISGFGLHSYKIAIEAAMFIGKSKNN